MGKYWRAWGELPINVIRPSVCANWCLPTCRAWEIGELSFLMVTFLFLNILRFIFEREEEYMHEHGRGGEQGRQKIQSGLCSDSSEPSVGLEIMT